MAHTGDMRVLLKLVLDCEPDAAWLAIRSPSVFREVSWPLTSFESLEPGGFPELWEVGEHPVRASALGGVTMGDQIIDVSFEEGSSGEGSSTSGVRIMRDTGRGLSGPLALVTSWRHSMAIAPAPGGKTLYRDELRFEAGALTIALWPVYWAFWQWRAVRLAQLARHWN